MRGHGPIETTTKLLAFANFSSLWERRRWLCFESGRLQWLDQPHGSLKGFVDVTRDFQIKLEHATITLWTDQKKRPFVLTGDTSGDADMLYRKISKWIRECSDGVKLNI